MTLRHLIAIIVFGTPIFIYVIRMYLWKMARNKKSRLPVTNIPRPAGWSLQKRIGNLDDDVNSAALFLVFGSVTGAVIYLLGFHLLWAALPTLPFAIYGLCKLLKILPEYANCSLGLTGEQAVGAVLNSLSSDQVKVFHDFPVEEHGKKPWNIDHVVVAPDGVFVIETKARRKSRSQGKDGQEGHVVRYDGKRLHFPFSSESRDLKQSQGNADWMADFLTRAVGDPVIAQPVLVILGWMVKREGRGEVDVLNEKNLYGHFTGRRKGSLSSSMQRRICYQLEQHCKIDLS